MAKRNGNGHRPNFLAQLVESVAELRAEFEANRAQFAAHAERVDRHLEKRGRTLAAAANVLEDHERRLDALESK